MNAISRGERAIHWIEKFCLFPNGPDKGRRVRLLPKQRAAVLRIYDGPAGMDIASVSAPLSGYLALLHVCGPEAVSGASAPPHFAADFFSVWNAAGPELRVVLKRDGERIICPELGTRWSAAA
jgi:hypothetical protein